MYHSFSKAFEDVKFGSIPSTIEQSTVYEDNCLNGSTVTKDKNIEILCYWLRSKVESFDICIEPVETYKELVDQSTNGLALVPFEISCHQVMD
jgi:hypothetical protein